MPDLRPFHLAFPVKDIEETKDWYCSILGCSIGRQGGRWIDFKFFGHQISAHLSQEEHHKDTNLVDGHKVPARHFGIILTQKQWLMLTDNLIKNKVEFIIEPYTRFKGETGEQSTMFIKDPSGNALEFKAFKNDKMIFEN